MANRQTDVDDLYFLLDMDDHVLDAMYLTKDQATAIEHVLDIVEHCGNEFTLAPATDGGNIPDFRPAGVLYANNKPYMTLAAEAAEKGEQ